MKKGIIAVALSIFVLSGCAAKEAPLPEGYEEIDPNLDVTNEEVKEALEEDLNFAQSVPYEGDMEKEESEDGSSDEAEAEEEEKEDFMPGYETEEDFWLRKTGSASYIWEPTVVVSIFIDEEEDLWTQEEKDHILDVCNIAYPYLENTLAEDYDTDCKLIYDWKEDPDLCYDVRIYESISPLVGGKEESHINDLAREWVRRVPYKDLMTKYDTTSIAFLYLIPHEGCSYSEMHCLEDKTKNWNEGSIMYLQDVFSDDLDYETPTVYAHELLHLFGAEDLYKNADIFSPETYDTLKNLCPDDIMLKQFEMINGVYTTYPDEVHGEISPVTAYLLGIGDESVVEEVPELIRTEAACFPGSSKDREFDD